MENDKFTEMCNPKQDSFVLEDKRKEYKDAKLEKKKKCC